VVEHVERDGTLKQTSSANPKNKANSKKKESHVDKCPQYP